jgi:DNA-binding protein Fis
MHFNNLEELSLRFDDYLNAEFLKTLHEEFYLPKLRVLKASKVNHGEKELVNIFMTHQHTLKKVIIDRGNLSTLGSWKWLVDEVQQKLSLTLLMLSHCTVDDRYDLLLLEQPSPLLDACPIILLRDRTEMNRAIRKLTLRVKERALISTYPIRKCFPGIVKKTHQLEVQWH